MSRTRRTFKTATLVKTLPNLRQSLTVFQAVERPGRGSAHSSGIIPEKLIQALLGTQNTSKAIQFACPPAWQKRVCDALYAFVRKARPSMTAHRVCVKEHVTMWVAPLKVRSQEGSIHFIPNKK